MPGTSPWRSEFRSCSTSGWPPRRCPRTWTRSRPSRVARRSRSDPWSRSERTQPRTRSSSPGPAATRAGRPDGCALTAARRSGSGEEPLEAIEYQAEPELEVGAVVVDGRDRVVDHLPEVWVLVRWDRMAEGLRHLLGRHVASSGEVELLSTETVDVAVQDRERTGGHLD